MKKALILCCLLFLSACIEIDDYGDYWAKSSIDPALQGRWAKLNEDDETKLTGDEWAFKLKDGAYSIRSFKNGKAGDEDPLYPVKTFTIGKYKFIASGPDKGSMLRYEINGNVITWYVADPEMAWDFISKKYPQQDNIYRDDPDEDDTPEEARDRPLRVEQLDDDVAAMIASIPNNPIYWDPDTKARKVQ